MTDEKIKALIVQIEIMIARQEESQTRENVDRWVYLDGVISGMRQVLAVIRLYEE